MGTTVPDSKTPALIAFAFVAAGILIAMMGGNGILRGSIPGGIIAALGVAPACYGMWKGIQQETQGTLAVSVTAVIASLGVGAILIILRLVHWVTP